jgi:hypothetical protein
MNPPGKITQKQLSKKLVEKHERLLNAYSKEFKLLQGILVLREKKDLLEHWIEDAKIEGDEKKRRRYMKQKKTTEGDILKLRERLEEITPSEDCDSRQRYESLGKYIESHREAINYWGNITSQNE